MHVSMAEVLADPELFIAIVQLGAAKRAYEEAEQRAVAVVLGRVG